MVVGNNGGWGLEKHPMRAIYGYDVAAELRPETRYDEVVRALGGAGETVRVRAELGPALDRAFASGVPYLVNVLTDPDDATRGRPCWPEGLAEGPARPANRSRSTIARVMRPVATGRPSWVSLTSKVSLRAVRSTSWASAWTVLPTGLGRRWSSSTWVPTLVWPGVSEAAAARTVAASASASARGVPRTSTSPEPRARAVSASVTVIVTLAESVGSPTRAR